jgi:hypothetical protein
VAPFPSNQESVPLGSCEFLKFDRRNRIIQMWTV